MTIETADKVKICSTGQDHDLFDVDLKQNFHFWVLLKTLVDLRFLPNDAHEARKWSCITALLLSLCVYNVDIAPGLINKGVEPAADLRSCPYILSCMYPLCCPLPLCIHGNSCLLGSTTVNQQ